MKEKIVLIEWEDASYNSGYYNKKEPERFEPVVTRSVGHLIKKTSKAVILGMERFYDAEGKPDDERYIVTIPRKMIKKIEYLNKEE